MTAEQSYVADFVQDGKSYVHSTTSKFLKASSNFAPTSFEEVISFFKNSNLSKADVLCMSGVDTLVLNWYIRLLDPPVAYLQHLDYFRTHDEDGSFTEYKSGGCIDGFYFYKHKRDDETWTAVPDVVCDNYNPCAKFKSIRSSASRTFSQLKNLRNCNNIVFLDLTFPKPISKLLLGSNQVEVLEKAHKCVSRFIDLLHDNLEAHINKNKEEKDRQFLPSDFSFGLQYNPHLWATANPIKPHLHIHMDLLWAFYSDKELHPLKFHDTGKPLSGTFVKDLWKKAVSEVFGYNYGDKNPSVHLAWSPLSRGAKVLHRLKYRRRKPITDLAEYYIDNEFDPDNFDDGFNKFLLDYSNMSYSHGFWTFLVKLLNDSCSYSANVKVCPVCGEKVSSEVYFPIGEAVFDRVVIRDRHGCFYSVEPPP